MVTLSPPELSLFTRVVNAPRIHNVPVLNFAIILVLGSFLLKLTTKYNDLYMKSSLVTIIVTNLVLYGISETLAQSLLSYSSLARRFAVVVNNEEPLSYSDLEANTRPEEDGDVTDTELMHDEHVNEFLQYLDSTDADVFQTGITPAFLALPQLTFFQFSRLAGFMCWGFIMGVCQCFWYKFLQIYSKDPKVVEVIRKVLSDQFVYSPISLFCFFVYGTMVLDNGTWDDATGKLRKVYLKTLMINYSVWFPVQFINFLMVPRLLQVPFSSSISVLWNCFLSMRNSQS